MKNIEFFGYVIELGDPSDNDPNHPISKLIHQYPENSSNQYLGEIFTLGATLDYSTLINIMYYLPELPLDTDYQFPIKRAEELGLQSEEDLNKIRSLIKILNLFYLESRFDKIWDELKPHREETLGRLESLKPSDSLIDEIERFYGTSFNQYEIVPSLTIWPGPGWGITTGERERATFVLGPLEKNYIFENESFQSLTIHEFGHSFVNRTVLQQNAQLEKTNELFLPVEEAMIPQGYQDWQTCMIEHFVRAGEVIVMEQMGQHAQSEELLNDYRDNRKFIYLDFIVDKLKEYRLEKKLYYQESVRATLSDLYKYHIGG